MNNNQFTENEVKELIVLQSKDIFEKANNIFSDNQILFRHVSILFNLKGCVAGRAYSRIPYKIKFNLVLAKNNLDDFLINVVGHEIAHLYQRKKYPYSKPHGREFKNVMRLLGYNPSRCHSYDTSKVKQKRKIVRYVYECTCPINSKTHYHYMTRKRHEQIQTQVEYHGRGLFYCKTCHSFLKYNELIGKIVK